MLTIDNVWQLTIDDLVVGSVTWLSSRSRERLGVTVAAVVTYHVTVWLLSLPPVFYYQVSYHDVMVVLDYRRSSLTSPTTYSPMIILYELSFYFT